MQNTIEETICSVLDQKGDFDLEYIVTDAKSTDNTVNIIKKYWKHLTWISEKDTGQSDGINKGLKMSTGDIVAFLNADDLYLKNTLHKVTDFFKKHARYKWLTGFCRIIDKEGKEIRQWISKYKNERLKRYSYNNLLIEDFISQPSTFWRRELLDSVGFLKENLNFCMDYDYWCRIGEKYSLGLIQEYLSSFRFYPDSKTASGYRTQLKEDYSLVTQFTKNPYILFQKRLHNLKRLASYRLLEKLKK